MTDIGMDFNTLKPKISLLLDTNDKDTINKLKNEDKLNIEIKKWRKSRSLNANAYAWKLISELAEVLKTTKEEMYEIMLQRYGTNQTDIEGQIIIISSEKDLKPVPDLHIEFIGASEVKNKTFNHYRVIKGSSQYNSKEMSIFIDGIVGECKEQEIEILSPAELESLKNSWK